MNGKHMRLWAACVSCVAGTAGSAVAAPVQWRVEDGGSGHWYEVGDVQFTRWTDGRDYAISRGGHLATLTTAQENSFVARLRSGLVMVGGLQDPTSPDYSEPGGGWRWITGEPWQFAKWKATEPNNGLGNGDENYLTFWRFEGATSADDWNDMPNNMIDQFFAAIEWDADCNGDGIVDYGQISSGQLADMNHNGIPDVCENLCHTATWFTMGTQGFGNRWFHSQAYSGANSGTLLFGGSTAGTNTLGDTWLNTGSTWTQVAATGPAARNESAMCGLGNGHVLLFGGVAIPTNAFTAFADTWDWNGTAWTRISTALAPTARLGHRMAYDSIRNRVVLFGGLDRNNALIGDTWEWDGSAWMQVATTGPQARFAHALAYDPLRGKTVLYGGHNVVDLGDTWEWNGAVWTQMATAPAGRTYPAAAYHPELGGVVMSGGSVSGVISNETLLWNGTLWQTVQMAGGLTPHWVHTMSYDAAGNRLVVAGGSPGGTVRYADAWELSTAISVGTPPQTQTVHAGTPVSFNVTGRGPVSGYQWRKGGVAIANGGRVSGATSASLTIANVQESDAGMYDCILSSECHSVTSSSALLTVIVCPGDFNHDGSLDLFDYLDFVAAFAGNDPSADFNADHSIDFFDYLDFVERFSSGC